MRRGLLDVEDLLQRVFIRVDEEASVDFNCRVGAEMRRVLDVVVFGFREFVHHFELREKPCN